MSTVSHCPACDTENPEHARFCMECGASLASVAQADRRVVTILFADLSGFTRLTEQLDAEEVSTLVGDCLERLSGCVLRWGGFVDKFIGDCVMALFGAPVAHENEEERALRAALDMQAAVGEMRAGDEGFRPELRIGVNTGSVVTGVFAGGAARDYTAVGDSVNVASRLQGLCEPGEILVGASTCEATRHLFEFGEEQVLDVKGRQQPVQARRLLGERAERGRARGFGDRRVPLVGRSGELAALRERWDSARNGRFRICLLAGEPGIGKTRLVEELITAEELPPERIARGYSYPHSRSTPWEPLTGLVRNLYGLPGGLDPATAAGRIAASRLEPGRAHHDPALEAALGAESDELPGLASYGPQERRERIGAAVLRALEGPDDTPRLLVLDDLHWADSATLEFLLGVAEHGLPSPGLLVLVSRPPLPDDVQLGRLLERLEDRIEVPPLSPGETREFVEASLGEHKLPEELIDRIVDRAEGNPLFVEESLKSLVESGALRRSGDVWEASGDPGQLQVPDTIESVLTTRIDGLDNATRTVLQYAAVVGRKFWSGVVGDALARRPVEGELARLREGAFVRALPRSSVPGDREYIFEHLLLQEVTYQGMLRGLRNELHGAVARWLEGRLGDDPEYQEPIAFHFERSGEPERALPYLERAAAAARSQGALADARTLLERALTAATQPVDTARILGLLEAVAADAGEGEARRAVLDRLQALASESDEAIIRAEAAYRRARYLFDTGQLDRARAAGLEALELFREADDVSLQGDALRLLGRVAHLWGDHTRALQFYRSSLQLERQAADRHGQAEIYDRLGLVQVDLGDFARGLDYFELGLQLCRELGDLPGEARVLAHRATALRALGAREQAVTSARSALELARRCGARQAEASAELNLGMALAASDESDEARDLLEKIACKSERPGLAVRAWLVLSQIAAGPTARECAERARELARESGVVHVEILATGRLAELAFDEGELQEAAEHSSAAVAQLEHHGSVQGPEERLLLTHSRVLRALGREADAEDALERARAIVRAQADRIQDPGMRDRYLSDIPLNREILGPEAPGLRSGA